VSNRTRLVIAFNDEQLDTAEETASHAIDLPQEKGEGYHVCRCRHGFGDVYCSKGEMEKTTHHLEVALGVASSFNWLHPSLLSCIHISLADLLAAEDKFDDAHAHTEHAKLHEVNDHDTRTLARVTVMQQRAEFWHKQHQFEEAKSEALRTPYVFEMLGAVGDVERVRELLR
jgi:hypothetical protein